MSNALYPSLVKGLTYTVLKTPEFSTLVQKSPNGSELRIPQTQNPLWHWSLIYEYLYDAFNTPDNTMPYAPYTDLQALMGFFLARQGQNDDFLFLDPDDNYVGPALIGSSPNLQAQLQLVTDGAGNWYTPIQRNLVGGFWEDITDIATIQVYANGVRARNYSLNGPGLALPGQSFMGLYLQWFSLPATPITAQFNFYFRVRFETDTQDFEKFMAELWTIGGDNSKNGSGMLKLVSSRPGGSFLPGAQNMLMNYQGLVVNAFNNQEGRGDYFDEASGTSESQFLLILGLLEAYKVTANADALSLAQTALGGLLPVLYRGGSIPATVDATHIFAPHWLFCVKQRFQSALINYNGSVNFVNGVGTLADPFGIGRYIFQVTSIGATLLWQNPYSALSSGTSYPFTYSWGGGVGTIIMTGIAAGWNGPLQVIYSTQNGPMLTPGDPYEAWPDWRTLAPGEIDSACDTYNWAYRAYLDASTILGGQWTLAAAATLAQAAIVYDINDSRDWIKPTYTGSPFSDGSRFSYTDRTPTAPTFSCDAAATWS